MVDDGGSIKEGFLVKAQMSKTTHAAKRFFQVHFTVKYQVKKVPLNFAVTLLNFDDPF